ncbi:MAG: hypothetical protein R3B70_01160 [Polyangiaceae bacterium]
MRRVATPLLATLALSCAQASEEPAGAVVVGITADFQPGPDIARLSADVRVDGELFDSRVWIAKGSPELSFPLELPVSGLADGARVDVELLGFETMGENEAPFVRRDAATAILVGQTLLLRAHMEWECVPSFHLPGGELAPTCASPLTCVAAGCEDPFVDPSKLSPYSIDWAVDYADECRPEDAGEPAVEVGRGLESFEALAPGGPVPMVKGPQGGFHVWLALRARNLHRQGSVTHLQVTRQDSGEELCAVEVPWDFEPSGDGSCDLAGIQCVVSYDVAGAAALTGQAALVSAKVVDSTGDVGFGEQVVTLSVE